MTLACILPEIQAAEETGPAVEIQPAEEIEPAVEIQPAEEIQPAVGMEPAEDIEPAKDNQPQLQTAFYPDTSTACFCTARPAEVSHIKLSIGHSSLCSSSAS